MVNFQVFVEYACSKMKFRGMNFTAPLFPHALNERILTTGLCFFSSCYYQGDEILRMSEYTLDKPLKPRDGQDNLTNL
ncbi:hypothetical protein SAMN03159341_107342 [Paenibacillus sp. 1_12]|nr:hypothetical protein SAMN03159341_107342 [Paenibacillus sp. 1_12]